MFGAEPRGARELARGRDEARAPVAVGDARERRTPAGIGRRKCGRSKRRRKGRHEGGRPRGRAAHTGRDRGGVERGRVELRAVPGGARGDDGDERDERQRARRERGAHDE